MDASPESKVIHDKGSTPQPHKHRLFNLPLLPSGPDGFSRQICLTPFLRKRSHNHQSYGTRLLCPVMGLLKVENTSLQASAPAWRRFQVTRNAELPSLAHHLIKRGLFYFKLWSNSDRREQALQILLGEGSPHIIQVFKGVLPISRQEFILSYPRRTENFSPGWSSSRSLRKSLILVLKPSWAYGHSSKLTLKSLRIAYSAISFSGISCSGLILLPRPLSLTHLPSLANLSISPWR